MAPLRGALRVSSKKASCYTNPALFLAHGVKRGVYMLTERSAGMPRVL